MDLDGLDVDPDERILLTSLPSLDVVRRLAGRLENGIIAALAEGEEMYAARRELAGLENVLVTPGSAEDIPWKDEFFSLVADPAGRYTLSEGAQREMERVLAPSGRLFRGDTLLREAELRDRSPEPLQ